MCAGKIWPVAGRFTVENEEVVFAAAAPASLHGSDLVRRPTLLFKAGEYADKGVTVTEDDIDRLIARFNEAGEAPVKVEHMDTPLDPFGHVVALYRRGPDLFGMLTFSAGVDALIEERGVKNVSISLVRESEENGGGFRMKETSLVFSPRVAGAGFLSEAATAAAAKIARFCAEGRLTPAMVPAAKRLLAAPSEIRFSDGSALDVAAITEQLLAAMPVVQPRQAAAAASFGAGPSSEAAPSETVKAVAAGFGLDPVKVMKNMKGVAAAAAA